MYLIHIYKDGKFLEKKTILQNAFCLSMALKWAKIKGQEIEVFTI